jgi:hypothetical protein
VRPAALRRGAPRAVLTLFALLITVGLPSGCRSASEGEDAADGTPEPRESTRADQLTIDDFRELIQKGALRPVEAMPEDASDFADPHPDQLPFESDATALETALQKESGAQPATAWPSEVAENPYLVFGKRIVVYEKQHLISKPFPLRVGLGV